jgi:addiction module HigA family antidote
MNICMHAGEFLKEVYMLPLKLSNQDVANKLGVSSAAVSRLVTGKASLSFEMAAKLSAACGNSVDQWLNLQNNFDKQNSKVDVSKVIKFK